MDSNRDQTKQAEQDKNRAVQMHDSFREELLKRQLSNSENYDKAILTLSSSGLAISISFINFIKDISRADFIFLMSLSWAFFTLAIILSLIAYYVGNKAIDKQLDIAEDYYLNGNNEAITQKNRFTTYNEWLNVSCGVLFILGIFCVAIFVVINVHKGGAFMSERKPTVLECINLDSASIPRMQRVNAGEIAISSASIPRMQAAPATSTTSSTSTSTSTSTTSSASQQVSSSGNSSASGS